ncbi:hypothetical protein [Halomonas sp. LBP4]|uniref:hypothetical protein n=1 Tax=Halomonas sp. LBP4 TaxID=2044917 RepID=UPI000D76A4CC|nr:hypothetical protein [Halomonas sp. LBP4]PXX95954.1 hypothetical protein CR157_17330 [Halomonas sp. LBP4]
MHDLLFSAAPVVHRETAHLIRRTADPVAETVCLEPFGESLLWLRETEATLLLVHRGATVKELATYNDYYGFLRSVDGALEDVPGLCHSYRVTSDSELALQLDLVVIDTCVKPAIEEKAWGHKAAYHRLNWNNTWWRHDAKVLAAWESTPAAERTSLLGQLDVVSPEPRRVATHTGLWHSLRDDAEPTLNHDALAILSALRQDTLTMAEAG